MAARYIVHNGDQTLKVTIAEKGHGYEVEIDGETVQVECRSVGGSTIRSLIIDGSSYESGTMHSRDGTDVYISGDVFRVRVTDELWARAEEAAQAGATGQEEVASPMPGAVVKIPVEVGQLVDAGDTVAVVEAMKMQNDIATARGGEVQDIRVKSGDVVDQGAVLVVLGAPEEPGDA